MAKKGEATAKKSPAKKPAAAKPVKRLAGDKADKPAVQLRKSSRNVAASKEDVPEENAIDEVAKKVKVTSDASKKTKKAAAKVSKSKKPAAKAPDSDESVEETDHVEDPDLIVNDDNSADVKIAKVSIEHCKSCSVFKRKALEIVEVLSSSNYVSNKDEFKSELNPTGKQRSGSFEITVTLGDGKEILVWSGIKRGPPRKLKFPESEVLMAEIKNKLHNLN